MGFGRSSITDFLQPAYLVVPENHGTVRGDRKPLRRHVLRQQRALRLVDTVESAAGRIVGDPASSAGDDPVGARDRKSTRLNSSHTVISYAVFCLKKKKKD